MTKTGTMTIFIITVVINRLLCSIINDNDRTNDNGGRGGAKCYCADGDHRINNDGVEGEENIDHDDNGRRGPHGTARLTARSRVKRHGTTIETRKRENENGGRIRIARR